MNKSKLPQLLVCPSPKDSPGSQHRLQHGVQAPIGDKAELWNQAQVVLFLQRFTYLSCRGPVCSQLNLASPQIQGFSFSPQYTKHDTSVGSIHENTPSKSNFNSFTQNLENSFYGSNRNNPDKVSYSRNVKTSSNPPYNREGAALFLLHLLAPCWLSLYYDLRMNFINVLCLTLTLPYFNPCFPNNGLAAQHNPFFLLILRITFHFEERSFAVLKLRKGADVWSRPQHNTTHGDLCSSCSSEVQDKIKQTNPPQNCINYVDNLTSIFTSLLCHRRIQDLSHPESFGYIRKLIYPAIFNTFTSSLIPRVYYSRVKQFCFY